YDCAVRPEGMANAELVEGVPVPGRQISDHDVRGEELLEHRHVNDTGMDDLIGARALESCRFGSRLNDIPVRLVEIEQSARLKIGLPAESHDDKASFSTP